MGKEGTGAPSEGVKGKWLGIELVVDDVLDCKFCAESARMKAAADCEWRNVAGGGDTDLNWLLLVLLEVRTKKLLQEKVVLLFQPVHSYW